MDTEKYDALIKVIKIGNLTEAAAELGYTVSGLSRMMTSLEDENGFPLLYRGRHGVSPTENCLTMLPLFEELVHKAEQCRDTSNSLLGLETGEVRIGTAYTAYYQLLGPVITAFTDRYPGIKIEVRESFSSALAEALDRHDIDFCIMSRRDGHYEWQPLTFDRMVAWVPVDFPAGPDESLPMDRFETENCIEIAPGEMTDNMLVFQRYDIKPNYRFTARNDSSALAMVEAGLGITMGNELYSRTPLGRRVKVLALDPDPMVEIGIATLSENQLSPAVLRFRQFALDYFRGHSLRQESSILRPDTADRGGPVRGPAL